MPLSKHRKKERLPEASPVTSSTKKSFSVYMIVYAGIVLLFISLFGFFFTTQVTTTK